MLLANYALNPPLTNRHLVHLLHKIAVKQHLPGVLFQLRLFHVFQTIIEDPVVGKLDEFKEMLCFIKYILRKFFATFERSHLVAVEALFLKSTREAAEAHNGYGTYESGHKKFHWTTELDKELDQLFEAYRYDPVPKGEDLVDVLKRNLSDPGVTRRQIIMRLIYLGKVASAKNLKMMTIRSGERGVVRRSQRPPWSEEEINLLHSLFLEHNGSSHRLDDVMTELRLEYEQKVRQENDETPVTAVLRSRREVKKKLMELGLVEDLSDFGHHRRQARQRRNGEMQLETLDGGISRVAKVKRSSHRRRWRSRQHNSSPELLLGADERFSDEVYQEPTNFENVDTTSEEEHRSSKESELPMHSDSEASSKEDSDVPIQRASALPPHAVSSEDVETSPPVSYKKRRRVALEDNKDSVDEFADDDTLDVEISRAIQEAKNASGNSVGASPRRIRVFDDSDEDC
ncbi:unnamed protein product [Hydatigera taeniaeformis]|uniref:Timeless C-terminal domain-containing protein n=1 Tax=Hydatigena taeniaeformis TaxID=6205 RepID=A0A3P7GGN6_HYDTA|nr:unnamed protein product [Hydatigera taeniaeformis]